jgi:hypothetical protein
MENNDESSVEASTKRAKCFRKLRWKNYLHHLLNLWLFCVNVSVDGRDNGKNVVNLLHKSNSTIISETNFTTLYSNRSFNQKTSYANNNENHKSFNTPPQFSHFNRTDSHSMSSYDDKIVENSKSNFNTSNKSSLSEKVFNLIKSKPEQKGSSESFTNQSITSNQSREMTIFNGLLRQNQPMNIVNTIRITSDGLATKNDFHRVKKSENIASEGENKLPIHYNQSLSQPQATQKNQGNKKVRKKLKSDRKIPTSKNATESAKSDLIRDAKKLSKVSLLGLFEMTTHLGVRWEGKSELAAAELAVKHINERGLLPGYTLELITNDTQVTWGW